jgi:hypothetical protein
MSDYIFGRFAANSGFFAFLYTVVPNWQHFWAADALSGGGSVPWRYVLHAGLYAVIYSTSILSFGMFLFRHAEMK